MRDYVLNFIIMFIVVTMLLTGVALVGWFFVTHLPKPWGAVMFAIFVVAALAGFSFAADERKK